ncbi:solute carrier family 25 member 38 [Metschnikowia bicuspidata var. bicuspidata NRRL YB-4993]|uniref:Mitochondrial glycine transporter n=1 Tax=Metschnikowia bicuspidata var. bicuspidata NRRL YB-4993 TaxID=869754 RepID=A0A1A0H1Q0_9ASCO|nr:solute carrier family 25 member 38 [Metschnikowia bicuspidata var. bicuspidata NRRL YB-4993]OBA17956.1 solute carrier family 25 member 38 [Metschnikowia bicuspidata var. bicuspidata NRRL YB-4993]
MSNLLVSTPAADLQPKKPGPSVHLLSGGAAGLVSSFTLQPLDLLKTRLQQQQKEVSGYRTSVTRELRKLAHVRDLWRGALPLTLRTSVGAGLYFTILSQARLYLDGLKVRAGPRAPRSSVLPRLSHWENLATGFVVRALVGVVTMPITVIKTRFESNMYSYNSLYEGFEGIYSDGPARGAPGSYRNFFRGTTATLARDCPYAGLYVLFYEGFKNDLFPPLLLLVDGAGSVLAGMNNTLAAVSAAAVSTTITAPFDAVKTRLQLASPLKPLLSIVAVTRQLAAEPGGVQNLFSGLSLRLGRKALSAGISWCIYEELLKML